MAAAAALLPRPSLSVPAAILLIIAGLWLLLQTIVGDLPRRLVSWSRGKR